MATVMAVTALISAGMKAYEAYQAGKAEKAMRREETTLFNLNRKATMAENAEVERRAQNVHKQEEGQAKALAAASGVDSSTGSVNASLKALESENTTQQNWLKASGLTRLAAMDQSHRIAMQESKSRERSNYFQMGAAVVEGIGGAYSAGSDAGWWNNAPTTQPTGAVSGFTSKTPTRSLGYSNFQFSYGM